jgi:peroxiredoxin
VANGSVQLAALDSRLKKVTRSISVSEEDVACDDDEKPAAPKPDRSKEAGSKTVQGAVEAAIAELKLLQALKSGETNSAIRLLAGVKDLSKERQSQIQWLLGSTDKAEHLAAEAVKAAPMQVQPLANYVDILYRNRKYKEAYEKFSSLRELSAWVDLDAPVFRRLRPVADDLKYGKDWRPAQTYPADVGVRPPLNRIGPYRWQPGPAPQWSLTDSDGRSVSLKQYHGKPVIVIFYLGYGCPHCILQLNAFAPLAEEFKNAGISLVAIGTDSVEGLKKTVERAKREAPFPFPLLSDASLKSFKAYRAFDDFESMPLHGTFLVDGNGMVRWQDIRVAGAAFDEIDQPPHQYHQRQPKDRFSKLKSDFETGRIPLDRGSEKAFVASLLKALEIPASSQMLVFSTTSLQTGLITPSNPRALYFTDDLYLGYVPRGRIEIVSIDPDLGGIYYIFDIPKDDRPLRVERSERCMNCHAGPDTHFLPGLVIKSVIPGPSGGSLTAYRLEQAGHQVPLDQRFGGWYLTGQGALTNHFGNLTGRLSPQGLATFPVQPGKLFDFARYPFGASDVLPQLLHEHQAGFINRAVEATYRARTDLFDGNGKLAAAQVEELDLQARLLTRYVLFADEAPLSPGGVAGDDQFKTDFLSNRHLGPHNESLKDFDLKSRLFKYRCSYMIYSAAFQGLPAPMKERVYRQLGAALATKKPDPDYAYLPASEKEAIRGILKATLPDLPKAW